MRPAMICGGWWRALVVVEASEPELEDVASQKRQVVEAGAVAEETAG